MKRLINKIIGLCGVHENVKYDDNDTSEAITHLIDVFEMAYDIFIFIESKNQKQFTVTYRGITAFRIRIRKALKTRFDYH